jgi:molybdopterin molybdotransferase
MTKLAQDCFAYGGDRIQVDAAHALLRERIAPVVGIEQAPLADAVGRCLGAPLVAPRDVPAFDNAAVDGFAFAFAPGMREAGARLALLSGRAAAGHPFAGTVPPGTALRVLTGAVIPSGADTVVLQEEATAAEGTVTVPRGLKAGANRRRGGEDVRAGQSLLAAGLRLRPQEIGLAAELGLAALPVFRRLRVALLSTGDELLEPGAPHRAGGVYDANRPILRALLTGLPVEITDLGIASDDAAEVARILAAAAASHDVLVTSGGASRGDEDHVVRTVQRDGRLDFWQIAMKPGRPLAFGRLGGAVFVGLPGNPVATMVCFLLFARPVLLRLAGFTWRTPVGIPVPAAFAASKRPGRSEYLRARVCAGPSGGGVQAQRIAREGSGILTSMVEAEGLVELDAAVETVRPGDPVPFFSFAELGIPA